MGLKRFGVSVPEDLLERFDEIVRKKGYVGRSEAIRDAMRGYISQSKWESEQTGGLATLNIVYQHKPSLMAKLVRIQHNAKAHAISSVHVHATHSHCLEVIVLKGSKKEIEKLADEISGISGVEHAKLFTYSIPMERQSDHIH